MSRLFIIGNGFDLAHGFSTKYIDFKAWIESQVVYHSYERSWPFIPIFNEQSDDYRDYNAARNSLMKLMLHMFERLSLTGSNFNWESFEEALFYLNVEIYHDAQTEDIITEEDGITPDYVMELSEQNADNLYDAINYIPLLFAEWIRTVNITNCQIPFGTNVICDNNGICSNNDIFVTFNYTETLEQNYCVPQEQIIHIHGFRHDGSKLVVGYGNPQERKISLSTFGGDYEYARKQLYEAMKLLKKDTSSIIQQNSILWHRIETADIQDIYCFGFSYSTVDLPYIKKICSVLNTQNCCWWIISRSKSSAEKYKDIITDCGFKGCIKRYTE